MRQFWILAVLITSLAPAMAQENSRSSNLKDLLSGNTAPLSLKLKDLDETWRTVAIAVSPESTGAAQTETTAALPGGTADGYYTKGDTVAVGGETFLIVYRSRGGSYAAGRSPGQAGIALHRTPKLTSETEIFLSLINVRRINMLGNIRPFVAVEDIPPTPEADAAKSDATKAAVEKAGAPKTDAGRPDPAGEPADGSALTTASSNNLRLIALGITMYSQDYDDTLPPLAGFDQAKKVINPYIKNEQAFISPIDGAPFVFNTILSNHKIAHIKNRSEMALVYEASPAPDNTRGVAFLDGHVARIQESDWPLVKKRSKIP